MQRARDPSAEESTRSLMPKYYVSWSKTYYTSGSVEIEADSSEDAEWIVRDRMVDYEGSMQYDADKDFVEAYEQYVLVK
jgi:hypothetical protein